ncbi:MAG TPA: bifunctional hydroxymethylpyrimidine kinase/phosphomethylpyrimidine kinase [Candidatus Sulfotelmatobacter sp.]|nr:bifunctional hydroxymethylpyrimidine kinase/phosphomethylpyrimidine kinase [Candidatus Sulfotelmatobacter sp.]
MSGMPTTLTIAGSDSGGGAGIQADLKTFRAYRVFGLSAVTGLTAQNTQGVRGVELPTTAFIRAQLQAIAEDIRVDAVKTGMLATAEIIRVVATAIRDFGFPSLVVDPVMIAASGDALMQHEAAPVMRDHLFPLAMVVTPNLDEAGYLCGRKIATVAEMEAAARAIHSMGPRFVLLKGGHLPGGTVVDLLYDGAAFTRREGARIAGEFHGTGCTLSSAIAAGLARGLAVREAVAAAQEYVALAIGSAPAVGKGRRPLNHFPERFTPPPIRRGAEGAR